MKTSETRFPRYEDDLYRYLRDTRNAVLYLNASLDAALEEEDEAGFLFSLREVARARGGMRALSSQAGLNREHLFRLLSRSGNPELRSLRRILGALGFRLAVRRA